MKKGVILIATILSYSTLIAQDINYANKVISDLCSQKMAGRGYVNDGVNRAANYLASEFENIGLKKYQGSYFQNFSFPINTFPSPIQCTLDSNPLVIGRDFLLAPNSSSCNGTYKLSHFDLSDSLDKALYEKKVLRGIKESEAVVLAHPPKGFVINDQPIHIRSTDTKMIHGLRAKSTGSCELIFPDSIINNADSLYIRAENEEVEHFISKNVIGYIPAKKKKNRNKYIVFTAHYDHLGKMGQAIFPGASDNASGTAMVLNLAKHYAKCNNKYTMVFILFAGEEAGLIGSDFFTRYPTFNINDIKMLINLDIMGSPEKGVVVVNATEYPNEFERLTRINKKKGFLPEVRSRGASQNSDHYHFHKKGIPSFFIYANGGPGYYHDIYDTPESLTMTNYDKVFKLLRSFVNSF